MTDNLESITLRCPRAYVTFKCPACYLSSIENVKTFEDYMKSDIRFALGWKDIKNYFVKYTRYYDSFDYYIYDFKAFALFYSQMSFTTRAASCIPEYKFDPNSREPEYLQAINYLEMLAYRLPNDIEKITERIELLDKQNMLDPEEIEDEYEEPEDLIKAPEKESFEPLQFSPPNYVDQLIYSLKNDRTHYYLNSIDNLYDNILGTDNITVKINLLDAIDTILDAYKKEITDTKLALDKENLNA